VAAQQANPGGSTGGSLVQQRKRQEKNGGSSSEPSTTNTQPAGFLQGLSAQERFRERLATCVEGV
jgi:hypothetical protein